MNPATSPATLAHCRTARPSGTVAGSTLRESAGFHLNLRMHHGHPQRRRGQGNNINGRLQRPHHREATENGRRNVVGVARPGGHGLPFHRKIYQLHLAEAVAQQRIGRHHRAGGAGGAAPHPAARHNAFGNFQVETNGLRHLLQQGQQATPATLRAGRWAGYTGRGADADTRRGAAREANSVVGRGQGQAKYIEAAAQIGERSGRMNENGIRQKDLN